MKITITAILSLLLCHAAAAQIIYQNNLWYTTKASAYDAATTEGKELLFVRGTTICVHTINARTAMGREPLRTELNNKYILWFCDAQIFNPASDECRWALEDYPHLQPFRINTTTGKTVIDFPVIATANTNNPDYPIQRRYGPIKNDTIHDIFVKNEDISSLNKCYIKGNDLFVSSQNTHEHVFIYSITGILLETINKTELEQTCQISLPNGIYVIQGKNWNKKIAKNAE